MLNNCEAKGLGCVLTLPIYRGREQHGNGREAGDKSTGSERVGYGRREVLTPLPSPPPPPHTHTHSASQASGVAIPDKCSDRPKLCRTVVVILIRLNQARKQISSLL